MTTTIDPAAVKETCQSLSDFAAEEYQRGKRDGSKDFLHAARVASGVLRRQLDNDGFGDDEHEALFLLEAAVRKAESA